MFAVCIPQAKHRLGNPSAEKDNLQPPQVRWRRVDATPGQKLRYRLSREEERSVQFLTPPGSPSPSYILILTNSLGQLSATLLDNGKTETRGHKAAIEDTAYFPMTANNDSID